MKIEAHPSPNFNDRKYPIDMLVLHYTGMETGQAALDRMCDPAAEVSAHYMVWEDGRIAQLVGEDKRAWHAGVSSWQGDEDLNSRSIGIEIVNGGHDWPLSGGALPPYPEVQIEAVIKLCQGILARWDIPQSRIVGHSDVAPARKDDPGEHFPWARCASAGIGLWPPSNADPSNLPVDEPHLIGRGLGRGDAAEAVERLQKMLSEIGYELAPTGRYDEATEATVKAFQRRWLQDQVTGQADLKTLHMMSDIHSLFTA
ncbi:MAG: N-acetylmuramoyl-L-alanine amidase [Pseudomonadota bacterium]